MGGQDYLSKCETDKLKVVREKKDMLLVTKLQKTQNLLNLMVTLGKMIVFFSVPYTDVRDTVSNTYIKGKSLVCYRI